MLFVQFFIVHVSVPVVIACVYVMTFTRQSLGFARIDLSPEEWAGPDFKSDDELEFDDDPGRTSQGED